MITNVIIESILTKRGPEGPIVQQCIYFTDEGNGSTTHHHVGLFHHYVGDPKEVGLSSELLSKAPGNLESSLIVREELQTLCQTQRSCFGEQPYLFRGLMSFSSCEQLLKTFAEFYF